MEKLAKKIADRLSAELNLDDEKKEVVAYGMAALFQTFSTLLFVFLLGLIAGIPVEALIICLCVSLLRKYSGGAHLSSMGLCTFCGVLYSVTAAAVGRYLLSPLLTVRSMSVILAVTFAVSFFIIYKFAPVANPKKPIKTERKIRRMRRGSFTVLFSYLAVSLLFLFFGQAYPPFLGYGISLVFGTIWQIMTLTTFGAQLFHILDQVGNKICDNGMEVKKR